MTKVWFITGSSRGLGLAIAEKVLSTGDKVVATARHTDNLKGLVYRYGDQVMTLSLDVTDEKAVDKAINQTVIHFKKIDVLVNNAGFANMDSVEEMQMDSFKKQMDTDFYGTLFTIRASLPIMRDQKAGRIINISSVGGRAGSAGLGAYQSAKFAVGGLSEVVAQEVKPFNIHVTAVEPGGMRTDWGGSSMKVVSSHIYADTVGKMIDMIHSNWGHLDGGVSEPVKVADAIYTLSRMDSTPTHLLLGRDAEMVAKQHADTLATADKMNQNLTRSTSN